MQRPARYFVAIAGQRVLLDGKAFARRTGPINAGKIHPFPEGGIDPEQADRDWYEAYAARPKRIAAGGVARQKMLEARALAARTEIKRLHRLIADLECTTAPRERAKAAEARQIARLHAVLAALPDLAAPGIAAELQLAPQTIHTALAQFTAQLEHDIGPLLSRTDGFSSD